MNTIGSSLQGYTSRGGEFMLFNKTHLKSNVSYYEDICRKSPICIGLVVILIALITYIS